MGKCHDSSRRPSRARPNRAETAGHRSLAAGPLRLVLLDTSHDTFTADDAEWLDDELATLGLQVHRQGKAGAVAFHLLRPLPAP